MLWNGITQTAAAVIGALILMAVHLGTAQAAPAQQCQVAAFRQDDMAGVFVSSYHQMRLEIYPCGGSYLQWTNVYGEHTAIYYGTNRLTGGGIAATKMPNSPGSLDATDRIGFKPGVPGTIEVITVDAYGQIRGFYTLRKIS